MASIKQHDFIHSVADALQFISYYHPVDFLDALKLAYDNEQNPAAKDAIGQILHNSRMSAEGKRPLCQDTGIVTCFVKVGMDVIWDDTSLTLEEMVNLGTRLAYTHPDNPLRASIVQDSAGLRVNTKDNTPAVVHVEVVKGNKVEVILAAKGGGSENKARLAMLNPSDDVVEWVLQTLPTLGAGWCPPGIVGIGIGGTAEKAMLLAKEALMEPVSIHELQQRGATTTEEALRLELYTKINQLGIGAQGLGGVTTVLDVKVASYPTHAVAKPVALIPNCAANRHIHFTLDGSGPAVFTPPALSRWPVPDVSARPAQSVNLDSLTKADMLNWRAGDTLLLSGTILTGRDAAHQRIAALLAAGKPLPEGVDFKGKFIYYVGPVDAVRDEVVGPAGPTTSNRLDKYTDMMLGQCGLLGMIGKAERGSDTVERIHHYGGAYLMAVGGAAYLVSKAIKQARVVAFPELGMEAIYEFVVEDMPVTVAVDPLGNNIHETGPAFWSGRLQVQAAKNH